MHKVVKMNANMITNKAEVIFKGSDKDIENALYQVSKIEEVARSLEAIAYELAVHLETAKVANMINISAYLQRFAERCEKDLYKATSRVQ